MERGRVHSREFKLGVVRQVASGEKRPAPVCREHTLAAGLVLRWRREYEALERRIADLERLCGQLTLENAVQNKAVGSSPARTATR